MARVPARSGGAARDGRRARDGGGAAGVRRPGGAGRRGASGAARGGAGRRGGLDVPHGACGPRPDLGSPGAVPDVADQRAVSLVLNASRTAAVIGTDAGNLFEVDLEQHSEEALAAAAAARVAEADTPLERGSRIGRGRRTVNIRARGRRNGAEPRPRCASAASSAASTPRRARAAPAAGGTFLLGAVGRRAATVWDYETGASRAATPLPRGCSIDAATSAAARGPRRRARVGPGRGHPAARDRPRARRVRRAPRVPRRPSRSTSSTGDGTTTSASTPSRGTRRRRGASRRRGPTA